MADRTLALEASFAIPCPIPARSNVSRLRSFIELAVGYILIMTVIWLPRGRQRPFYLAAAIWIAIATLLSPSTTQSLGLRISSRRLSFWQPFWLVAAAVTLAATGLVAASRSGTLQLPGTTLRFIQLYIGYALWACFQQFLLQDFFLGRLLHILNSPAAAVAVATLLFSLAHLPNPILTPLTAIWGLVSCLFFLRYRNLYPLALTHAILGILVAVTIPAALHHNMRVGRGYLNYRRPGSAHHFSQNDHMVSTPACVKAEAPTLRSSRHALP